MTADYSLHDDALAHLAEVDASLDNGLINHAPMAIEALAAMGFGAAAGPWLMRYGTGFVARTRTGVPIAEADLEAAIGDRTRYEDWAATFRAEIETDGPGPVLERWCRRLAPGFVTGAAHGVLRTAHAARALQDADTPARRHELAEGLALWASSYTELPVALGTALGTLSAGDAARALTPVPVEARPPRGLIVAGYGAVASCPDFSAEVARADLSGDFDTRLDEVVVAFANVFNAHASTDFAAIVLTHAVTGAAAVGRLAPFLSEDTRSLMLRRAWEAGCALRVAFGHGETPALSAHVDTAALAEDAAAHGDDHVIKLTEACLDHYDRCGDLALLETASRVRALLPPAQAD